MHTMSTCLGTITVGSYVTDSPLSHDIDVSRNSSLGNPFSMGPSDDCEYLRQATCSACDEYMDDVLDANLLHIASRFNDEGLSRDSMCMQFDSSSSRLDSDKSVRSIAQSVLSGNNVRLMCYCAPSICHASSVASKAYQYAGLSRDESRARGFDIPHEVSSGVAPDFRSEDRPIYSHFTSGTPVWHWTDLDRSTLWTMI